MVTIDFVSFFGIANSVTKDIILPIWFAQTIIKNKLLKILLLVEPNHQHKGQHPVQA